MWGLEIDLNFNYQWQQALAGNLVTTVGVFTSGLTYFAGTQPVDSLLNDFFFLTEQRESSVKQHLNLITAWQASLSLSTAVTRDTQYGDVVGECETWIEIPLVIQEKNELELKHFSSFWKGRISSSIYVANLWMLSKQKTNKMCWFFGLTFWDLEDCDPLVCRLNNLMIN